MFLYFFFKAVGVGATSPCPAAVAAAPPVLHVTLIASAKSKKKKRHENHRKCGEKSESVFAVREVGCGSNFCLSKYHLENMVKEQKTLLPSKDS